MRDETKTKPTLHLAPPGMPTLKTLIAMCKAITGRDPTPEEIAAAQAELSDDTHSDVASNAITPSRTRGNSSGA